MRILVVEDEERLARLIRRGLRDEGHAVDATGSGEEAQASESLSATTQGEDVSIGFNPGYLLDGLGAIDAAFAHLSFTQATRPAVLQGGGSLDADPDGSYRYLLMPVRLSG